MSWPEQCQVVLHDRRLGVEVEVQTRQDEAVQAKSQQPADGIPNPVTRTRSFSCSAPALQLLPVLLMVVVPLRRRITVVVTHLAATMVVTMDIMVLPLLEGMPVRGPCFAVTITYLNRLVPTPLVAVMLRWEARMGGTRTATALSMLGARLPLLPALAPHQRPLFVQLQLVEAVPVMEVATRRWRTRSRSTQPRL